MQQEEEKVLVWVSEKGQPKHTTIGDVDCLGTIFGHNIDISMSSSMELVRVHANDKATEVCLSEFLAKHAPNLKPVEMRLCEL